LDAENINSTSASSAFRSSTKHVATQLILRSTSLQQVVFSHNHVHQNETVLLLNLYGICALMMMMASAPFHATRTTAQPVPWCHSNGITPSGQLPAGLDLAIFVKSLSQQQQQQQQQLLLTAAAAAAWQASCAVKPAAHLCRSHCFAAPPLPRPNQEASAKSAAPPQPQAEKGSQHQLPLQHR
jgi:hypothetical protein